MSIITAILILLIINAFFKRYMPMYGFTCTEFDKIYGNTDAVLLDVRDYQVAHRSQVEGAVNIPYAYLRRNHKEIEKREVYLIASKMLDINLSARFLKKKDIKVNGYYIKPQSEKQFKNCCFNKRRRDTAWNTLNK